MGTGTSYNNTSNYTSYPISFSRKVRLVGSVNRTNEGNYCNDCYFKNISTTKFIAVTSLNSSGNTALPFSYIAIGY